MRVKELTANGKSPHAAAGGPGAASSSALALRFLDCKTQQKEIGQIWIPLSGQGKHSYFLSWGWIENWMAFIPNSAEVWLAVPAGQEIPSFAFFIGKAKLRRAKLFRSQAYFLNESGVLDLDRTYIEYNSILTCSSNRSSLYQILEALPGPWDEIVLSGLDSAAFPGNQLNAPLTPYRSVLEKAVPSPYVDLEEVRSHPGGILALISSNTRAQIQRSRRLYEERGNLKLEAPTDLAQALEIYEELVKMNREVWLSRGQEGAFNSHLFYDFHLKLITDRFQFNEIQLLRLHAGTNTVGCLYNFLYDGKVYCYQNGFTFEKDNRLKPGLISHAAAIHYCAQMGYKTYDFLGGEERYKASLSTHQNRLLWVRVQKSHLKFSLESQFRSMWKKYKNQKQVMPVF